MKRALGEQEALFFGLMQMRKQELVRSGELQEKLRLTASQEWLLLSRLARRRLIARLRRGVYLVPPTLPLGGVWSPDSATALQALTEDSGGKYQICGPNTFNRYGYDEQVPNRIYAYNNRISGDRTVGSVELTLIKVADKRLGSTTVTRTSSGVEVFYSSRARTLVDAVYDWSRFNGLPRAYEWIRSDLRLQRVEAAELVDVTLKFGDIGTIRRMGAVLEREGVSAQLLRRLQKALPASKSLISLIPRRSRRGIIDKRWGAVINDQI